MKYCKIKTFCGQLTFDNFMGQLKKIIKKYFNLHTLFTMAYKEIHGAANQLNNIIPKYIPYIQQESVYGQKYLNFYFYFTI